MKLLAFNYICACEEVGLKLDYVIQLMGNEGSDYRDLSY